MAARQCRQRRGGRPFAEVAVAVDVLACVRGPRSGCECGSVRTRSPWVRSQAAAPRSVISRTPASARRRTSSTTEAMGRDRSRPRVNGTMQNEHMLSHPRMTDTNALPSGSTSRNQGHTRVIRGPQSGRHPCDARALKMSPVRRVASGAASETLGVGVART